MNTSTAEAKAQKPSLPAFSHKPTRPARAGQMGEYFFLYNWQRLNRKPALDFDRDEITFFQSVIGVDATDRDSVVVASFIRWLGTACGHCYAKELFRTIFEEYASETWKRCRVSAEFWAKSNIIKDEGHRLIQTILAREEDYIPSIFSITGYFFKSVEYSARDVDVIEVLHQWFGTKEGLSYLRMCMKAIRGRQRKSTEWHERAVFR